MPDKRQASRVSAEIWGIQNCIQGACLSRRAAGNQEGKLVKQGNIVQGEARKGRCAHESKGNLGVYGVPGQKLYHNEKQAEAPGTDRGDEILPQAPEIHAPQRDKVNRKS